MAKKVSVRQLERVDGGINNAFVNLQNSAKAALATIGQEIDNAINLQKVLGQIAAFLNRVANGFKSLSPATKKFIVIAAGLATALGPVLLSIGSILKLLPLMKAGLLALTGPVGLVVGAIAALAAGISFARSKSEKFKRATNAIAAAFVELTRIIKEVVIQFGQGISKIFSGDIKEGFKDLSIAIARGNPIGIALFEGKRLGKAFTDGYAKELEEEVPKAIVPAIQKADTSQIFAGFGAGTSASSGSGTGEASPSLPKVAALAPLQTLPESVQSITTTLEESLPVFDKVSIATETLGEKFKVVGEKLNEAMEGGFGTVPQLLGAAADSMLKAALSGEKSFKKLGQAALKGAAQVARAKIIEATVAFAADAFAKLGIFGTILAAGAGALVGGIFNGLISKIGIPALAEGGIVNRPTLALIGEAGPEAVVPLDKFNSGRQIAEARIDGKDLLILVRQAENDIDRIGL